MSVSSNMANALRFGCLVALGLAASACERTTGTTAHLDFESATVQRIPATIADGIALLPVAPAGTADVNGYYRGAIQQVQLKYIVGLLRAQGATIGHTDSPSIDSSDFRITTVKDGADGLKEVHYAMDLQALWPLTSQAPKSLTLVVPAHFDSFTPNAANDVPTPADTRFYAAFGSTCLNPDDEAITAGNAWYDYNPLKDGCPLTATVEATATSSSLIKIQSDTYGKFPITFSAPTADSGKHPDYAGLWRNNLLKVLVVSTPIGADATDPNDPSIYNLNYVQDALGQQFNELSRTTDGTGANGMALQTTITYDVGGGRKLQLDILHSDGFWGQDATAFFSKIGALSAPASVVYYAGHSSYGSAIRRLADLVTVQAKTPQIYYIDGCSTYFYSGETALWNKVSAVNPGTTPPGRFANLIVNGDAEPANENGPNLTALLNALVGETASYHDITAQLGTDSRPVVIGEESNPN